jgi:eukaryotic-like serine/threonine-protein kinase
LGHQSTAVRAVDRPAPARRFERWITPALVALGVLGGLWVFVPFAAAFTLTVALSVGMLAVQRVGKRLSTPPFPSMAPVPRVSVAPAARVGPERDKAELEVRADGGPRPGDVLGQYQLLACVGEGGMGRVWAARNVSSVLQRIVAVKTATRRSEQKTELRHLFMDEARIALLVRHPNVCGVNEFGEHEGVLYQVMEWCDGASLRQVLDRLPGGRMEIPIAVRIMAKVSAGLHAAHELIDDDGVPMHVVHRDVSPQNILISTTGQVKVTDFGVAKANGQLHRPLGSAEVKGKLSYIAPEQVMGGDVDRRADIFALGSILYEATTGHCPFSCEGSPSTLYQLISQPIVPPQKWVPSYPPELAEIVLGALGKDPADRYATAEQLGVALESWLAKMSLVVTERTIADMMTASVGSFTREKAKRIEHSLALSAPPSSVSATLTLPDLAMGPSVEPARPTLPARPNVMRAQSAAVVVRPSLAARPTLPAGPAARKPGVPR